MRAAVATFVALSLVSCSQNPSPLDTAFGPEGAGASDPWAALTGSPSADDKDGSGDGKDGGGLGFDLQGVLERIKDSIETPGPYEAPEKSEDYDAAKPHWGVLAVSGGVIERETFSFGGSRGTELRTLASRLRELAKQPQLQGVLLRVGEIEISLPDVVELHAAMQDLRAAGKGLRCHAESATNATYLVLSACERIALAPLGTIALTGPAAMPVHVKPLLDKLSIATDFIHVGAYKGAAEPLTRDAPSPEMKETIDAILDRRYLTMVETIATARAMPAATVRSLIDAALFSAPQARDAKLVDDVVAWETFRDRIGAPWSKLEIEPDDDDDNQLAAMIKIARFLGAMPPERPIGDHLAVVYALGDIKDGKGEGVLGARQEIASHTLVAALRALGRDASVKAVVLRIDSGGGSAQASELIWAAVGELRAAKPVIVSMSDVAASGGYYIASGANKIFAQQDTLTGSIGVIGGRIAPGPALANLGVNTFPMGRGKHATMMTSLGPWTAEEKALFRTHMEAIYTTFVARVAEGRKMTPQQVQSLAQGRVWTGAKAKELGLVDAIGGLDAAIAEARALAKLAPDSGIEVYPPAPTLRDFVAGLGEVRAPALGLRDRLVAELELLDPPIARAARRLLDLVAAFRAAPVQAVAILPVLR